MTDYAFEQRSAAEDEQAKLTYLEEQRKLRLARDEYGYGENESGQRFVSAAVACLLLPFIGFQLLTGNLIAAALTLVASGIFFLISAILRSRATTRAGNDRMLLELKALREAFETIVKNQRPRGN